MQKLLLASISFTLVCLNAYSNEKRDQIHHLTEQFDLKSLFIPNQKWVSSLNYFKRDG